MAANEKYLTTSDVINAAVSTYKELNVSGYTTACYYSPLGSTTKTYLTLLNSDGTYAATSMSYGTL